MSEPNENLLKLTNASGYLLQERLREEVDNARNEHGWQVVTEEHRWLDPVSHSEGFIDLVLTKGNLRIVIECKRVKDATWIFLIPSNASHSEKKVRCLCTTTSKEAASALWVDHVLEPGSPEARFCVIRGQGEREQPLLERLGGVLLRSVEGLAEEELNLGERSPYNNYRRFYFPAIVTNSRLYTCIYDPKAVDIKTGELPGGEFQEVDFIRFRKSLSTRLPGPGSAQDIRESNRLNERTVFVMSAANVNRVLSKWNLW